MSILPGGYPFLAGVPTFPDENPRRPRPGGGSPNSAVSATAGIVRTVVNFRGYMPFVQFPWGVKVPVSPVPLCAPLLQMQASSLSGRVWREGPSAAGRGSYGWPVHFSDGDRWLNTSFRLVFRVASSRDCTDMSFFCARGQPRPRRGTVLCCVYMIINDCYDMNVDRPHSSFSGRRVCAY